MRSSNSSSSGSVLLSRHPVAWAVAVVAALLAILFRYSLVPELTVFSNDGPLGAISAASGKLPEGFFGVWNDLNWIGSRGIGASPNLSSLWAWLAKPVLFSKTYPPLALLVVGVMASFLFRQLGFKPVVCLLGGLAATLNSSVFSIACWGLPAWSLSRAMMFLALGILVTPFIRRDWLKAVLAGLAVGMGVMEGFDVGAIYSLYVAAWVLFLCWIDPTRTPGQKVLRGVAGLGLVAFFAVFIAAQSLSALVSTQVQGVTGTNQDTRTKEERWDWATQWSLPKMESLRIVVPGLFGYRLDTENGGNYWGAVGRQPGWEQHHQGLPRHSGSGEYAGVLVILLAAWAIIQSLRSQSPFDLRQRQFIWFWAGTAVISLLFAWGRHAPFYQIIYQLPYFSTIRNPIKFVNPFHVGVLILFGFGLQDLVVRFLSRSPAKNLPFKQHLANWWRSAPTPEKRWGQAVLVLFGICLGALLIYGASRTELERYLTSVAFDAAQAKEIAGFSIREAAWFVFFLGISSGVMLLIVSGWLNAQRAKIAVILLGVVLVADLVRADQPWIIYYNYKDKYASNPVLDILRTQPHERRTAARLSPLSPNYLVTGQARQLFAAVTEEWLQHQYPYYQIQSLDIVQMPRVPEMDSAFMSGVLSPAFATSDFLQLGSFVAKLTNHSDAVSKMLWDRFSQEARTVLLQSSGTGSSSEILKAELNNIIASRSLYDPTHFAGVRLSEETQTLLSQNAENRDLVRFNRLLLQDAFPSEIARRSQLASFARLWQLTSTRLILGMTGFKDILNKEMDPVHHSFRIQTAFDFAPRESASPAGPPRLEDITAVIRPEGQFAVFEFGAALPRAKLYPEWQVVNDDSVALEQLANPAFDPQRTVLVANGPTPASSSSSPGQSSGTVTITQYQPKRMVLQATSAASAVLLLNDKFDPNWRVMVDGRPETLLRCNYIMRGVHLQPGNHQVEFRFDPPHWTLYVSLAAIGVGIAFCGIVVYDRRGGEPTPGSAKSQVSKAKVSHGTSGNLPS